MVVSKKRAGRRGQLPPLGSTASAAVTLNGRCILSAHWLTLVPRTMTTGRC